MALIRCEICMGKKKILSLGNLYKDCSNCKGIGKVKEEDKKEVDKFEDELLEINDKIKVEEKFNDESIKKRGRPARIK